MWGGEGHVALRLPIFLMNWVAKDTILENRGQAFASPRMGCESPPSLPEDGMCVVAAGRVIAWQGTGDEGGARSRLDAGHAGSADHRAMVNGAMNRARERWPRS